MNKSDQFCTPLKAVNVIDHTLDLNVLESQNQNRTLRLENGTAGYFLRVKRIVADVYLNDAGNKFTIDTSGGSNTDKTIIKWENKELVSQVVGSRSMGPGISLVAKPYTTAAPITTSLAPASWYADQYVDFFAGANNTLTLAPFAAETIDSSASDLVLSAGDKQTLYSDGTEWFKV